MLSSFLLHFKTTPVILAELRVSPVSRFHFIIR
jgi:hypothetical protein